MDNTPLTDFLKDNDESEKIQEILSKNGLFTIGDVLKENVTIDNVNIEERVRGPYSWNNWNMNQTCTPKKHFQPTTLEEVVKIIKETKGAKSIRAAGLGHSWSPLIPTDDVLILSSGLKGISVDAANRIATCQAGVSIKEFEDELNKNKLTMNTNVVLEDVYMVGVVESMCHGPGYAYSLVADNVIAITLVNYEGEVLRINEKEHPEDMKALRGALGTMGFVFDMTFRVIPLDTLEMRDETLSVQKFFLDKGEELKNKIDQYNGWVELFWVPFNDLFWMKSWKESTAPATKPDHTISDKMGSIFQKLIYAFPMLHPTDPFVGPLTKGFLKFIFRLMTVGFPGIHYWNRRHCLHWREFIHQFQVEDTEFAILVDPEYKNVKFAFQVIKNTIEKFAAKGLFPVDITVEIRFGKGSDTLLAPTNGPAEQKWCFIEFLRSGLHNKPGWLQDSWQEFVNEVCKQWIANENLKARVHWAKGYHKIPGIEKTIRKSFSTENWNKFKAVRDKYDPQRGA